MTVIVIGLVRSGGKKGLAGCESQMTFMSVHAWEGVSAISAGTVHRLLWHYAMALRYSVNTRNPAVSSPVSSPLMCDNVLNGVRKVYIRYIAGSCDLPDVDLPTPIPYN